MKVADLQDILGMIRQMLISAGGNKGAGELSEFNAALEPYRDMTAKQFATALNKLNQEPKAGTKGGKVAPAEVETLMSEIKALYDRAGSPTITTAEIEDKVKVIPQLTKADAVRIAEAIGLKGMKNKTIPVIAGEIRKRIEGRMGAAQRTGMIEVVVAGEDG